MVHSSLVSIEARSAGGGVVWPEKQTLLLRHYWGCKGLEGVTSRSNAASEATSVDVAMSGLSDEVSLTFDNQSSIPNSVSGQAPLDSILAGMTIKDLKPICILLGLARSGRKKVRGTYPTQNAKHRLLNRNF